jgi:ABC-type antimicrobial peptide transport system permease subunit
MPGNPLTDPNLAASVADTIERVVQTIRAQATDKIVLLARALVFGLVAAIAGLVAFVLTMIILIRVAQVLLGFAVDHPTAVWLSYLLIGSLLCALGAVLMRKRHRSAI